MNRPPGPFDSRHSPAPHREAIEARFAHHVIGFLADGTKQVPHDIGERLKVARLQAIDRARALRRLSPEPTLAFNVQAAGSVALGGPPSWWLRLASFVPLAVLLGGLLLIQHRYSEQQISAAAEIDAALLADELPPQAYSDPGFVEFLLKAPQATE
jgi:Protein of unknown function (DUF3619)